MKKTRLILVALLILSMLLTTACSGDGGVDDYEHEPEEYAEPVEAEEVSKWFDEWEKK